MILNKQQKEALVIDLLDQDISVPQIAKQANMSFSDIKRIRQKVTGDDKKVEDEEAEKRKKAKSMPCQAFELFLQEGPTCRWPSTWIWRLAG
jgi:sugar diacid utilization regulator